MWPHLVNLLGQLLPGLWFYLSVKWDEDAWCGEHKRPQKWPLGLPADLVLPCAEGGPSALQGEATVGGSGWVWGLYIPGIPPSCVE